MKIRAMRILVMFDLPMAKEEDRRAYVQFRKDLMKNGFLMMRASVYCKLALNAQAADLILKRVVKIGPPRGLVQLLTITEKQYSAMQYIIGKGLSGHVETVVLMSRVKE